MSLCLPPHSFLNRSRSKQLFSTQYPIPVFCLQEVPVISATYVELNSISKKRIQVFMNVFINVIRNIYKTCVNEILFVYFLLIEWKLVMPPVLVVNVKQYSLTSGTTF